MTDRAPCHMLEMRTGKPYCGARVTYESHSLDVCYAFNHPRCEACRAVMRSMPGFEEPRVLVDAAIADKLTLSKLRAEIEAEEKLSEDLANYVGRWVAVKDHRVVASADTLAEIADLKDVDGIQQVPVEAVRL